MTKQHAPLIERFWRRVQKTDTCWLWTGATTYGGYGVIQKGKRGEGIIRAHRLSYEIHKGPIPVDHDVCHTCDNPSCVNPNHLFPGTTVVNMRDCVSKGRNFTTGPQRPRGNQHPQAKLTEEQVIAIRDEYASGMTSTRKLAAKYEISRRSIMFIIHREQWTHI